MHLRSMVTKLPSIWRELKRFDGSGGSECENFCFSDKVDVVNVAAWKFGKIQLFPSNPNYKNLKIVVPPINLRSSAAIKCVPDALSAIVLMLNLQPTSSVFETLLKAKSLIFSI